MSSYLQPRPLPGQQQQVNQYQSTNFLSAVPIKKRRFPIIHPPSPEEKTPDIEDHKSKNKQDSQIPDEKELKKNKQDDPNDTSSSVNTSDLIAHKEVTPTRIESGQATVDTFVSKPQGAKPAVSLNQVADFGSETENISQIGKISLESEIPESSAGPQTAIAMQEAASRPGIPTTPMRVGLPSGQRGPVVFPDLEHQKPVAICPGPEKLDPSMLSLALSEEKPVELTIGDFATVGDVGTIRSNWDLNTTMEDWVEGSSKSVSLFAHTFADIGGFVKTSSCHDDKSSLSTAENFGLCLNKEKQHIPDVHKSNSSNATIQLCPQCNMDDSLGLRLDMPHMQQHSLSGNFMTTASPNMGLQRVPMSAINMNPAVKLESVDESSRRDCSVGSSSNSNMVSLGLGSMKTESFNNSRSMKSEVHRESCASSSSLPVPLMPQNYLELSIHNKELQLRPCNTDYKPKLARVDEAAAVDDEKINVFADLNKKSFGSDCGSRGDRAVGNSLGIRGSIHGKEDEDLEEGEVREPVQHPAVEKAPVDVWKNMENLEYVGWNSEILQGSGSEVFDGKDSVKENLVKSDLNKENTSISCKPNSEDDNNNYLYNVSDTVLEVRVDEKTFVSVTPDKQLNVLGRENFEETPTKEISSDRQTNVDSGIGGFDLEDAATTDANKALQEICPVENISNLFNMVEASLSGQDEAKDSGNKSRIINLSRASVVTSPSKIRPIPNRLMIPRSGKERYSDLDVEMHPWGDREVNYSAGLNKFRKDRVDDQSHRNSRPNFMQGRGRMSGRFSPLHTNDCNSDHDFSSETSYGLSYYRPIRRKHTPNVETDSNSYAFQQDGNNNRRKTTNGEFRRSSLRRLSPGDNSNREGPTNRGSNQSFRRFPRNMSSNGDKFMRHLSDDLMNPVHNHPQAMYDEPEGQLDQGNRNFSNMQRKGYPQIRLKSPVRCRTRSPGSWSSPRRRSPNGLHDLPQHRSPGFYRTGRMRSPERGCFRDEMFPRRRGSPYGTRHPNNDSRDVDPGRELAHPRPSKNHNRRGSPDRVFPRNARTDTLDSGEMGDGDEYLNNGSLQSNKFYDERRNFGERCGPGPVRLFRSGYNNGNGENFRFHMNDGPRPYRFCPDTDAEFVERGDNMREREFDGRIKHQPMGPSRRNRNVEELQDGNYRSVERVWHDDGFGDDSGKKRKF